MLLIILLKVSGFYIGLGIVLVIGVAFAFFAIKSGTKKKTTSKQIEAPVIYQKEEYSVDENDANLFHNLQNGKFTIRKLPVTKKQKDILVFSCSMPCELTNGDVVVLKATIPQLKDVKNENKHDVIFVKSAASDFCGLEDDILKFLFTFLHQQYSWLNEKQKVIIRKSYPNPDYVNFCLRVETCKHLDLGRQLMSIDGIVGEVCGDLPLCMNHKKNYKIGISKAESFSWEELLPELKKVFQHYFADNVEFTENTTVIEIDHEEEY